MDGHKVQGRPAATDDDTEEQAAGPGRGPALFHSNVESRNGVGFVSFAGSGGGAWHFGLDRRDAVDQRHFWVGFVLAEQAKARTGNPDRVWSAAQGGTAGRAGTRFSTASIWFGGRSGARHSRKPRF